MGNINFLSSPIEKDLTEMEIYSPYLDTPNKIANYHSIVELPVLGGGMGGGISCCQNEMRTIFFLKP